jgi:hypothetical protein
MTILFITVNKEPTFVSGEEIAYYSTPSVSTS